MKALPKYKRYVTIANCADALTLPLVIHAFLAHRELGNVLTLRAYRMDLTHLLAFLADRLGIQPNTVMFADVTKPAIESFRDARLKLESPASVVRRLSTISALFTYTSDAFGTVNRSKDITQPLTSAAEFKGLSEREYQATLDVSATLSPRDRFVVELLALTGLRCNEARALTFGQLSPEWKYLTGIRGKGGKPRVIPITPELRRCLVRYLAWREHYPRGPKCPLLISLRSPHGLNQKTIWRIAHNCMTTAGVPVELCHPHTFRHTFARTMLEHFGQRVSGPRALTMVMKLLGHASIDTTMIYLGNNDDEIHALMMELA